MTGIAQCRRMARCASGVTAIEFALVGLLVISLILGIFEFGRALFLRNQLAFAADIATRKILLAPPSTNNDLEDIEAAIRSSITFDQSDLEVDVGLPVGGVVPLALRQDLILLVPDLYQKGITLSVQRRIRLP